MRRIFYYLVTLPFAIVLILLSVANRGNVRLSLDPTSTADPALFVELPLFLVVFAAIIAGILIGGSLVWISQGKYRKALRNRTSDAVSGDAEPDETSGMQAAMRPELAPGLPVATRN